MENPHPAPENKSILNSTTYFSMGWVALFLMALMWSLDASFFYIFLGLACIFFFLGYWNRSPVPIHASQERERNKGYYQRSKQQPGPSFWQTLAALFKRQTTSGPAASTRPIGPGSVVAATQRKLALAVFVAIGSVFVIIILGAVFGESGGSGIDNFQQAEQYYIQEDYDSALLYYRRSLQEDPEWIEAMLGYGRTLTMLDRADSAHIMYDKILLMDPAYDVARYNKASLYFYQKNHAMAIDALKNLLDRNLSYVEAYLLLGDVYYDQENYDEAMRSYQTAYDAGLRSGALCHVMAYLHDIKGETPQAISLYKETLTYDSTVTDIYRRLGELIPGQEGEVYRLRAVDNQW